MGLSTVLLVQCISAGAWLVYFQPRFLLTSLGIQTCSADTVKRERERWNRAARSRAQADEVACGLLHQQNEALNTLGINIVVKTQAWHMQDDIRYDRKRVPLISHSCIVCFFELFCGVSFLRKGFTQRNICLRDHSKLQKVQLLCDSVTAGCVCWMFKLFSQNFV